MVKGTLARAIETRPRVQRAHIAFVASCQKSAMAPPKRDGDVHDKPKLLVEEVRRAAVPRRRGNRLGRTFSAFMQLHQLTCIRS